MAMKGKGRKNVLMMSGHRRTQVTFSLPLSLALTDQE